jgi:hypothetical protein
MALYQARFLKYLHGRGIADTAGRKVWAFMGDGEMDEPESLGAVSLAGRTEASHLLSAYLVKFPVWQGSQHTRQPFGTWGQCGGLAWYQDYNAAKHSRHGILTGRISQTYWTQLQRLRLYCLLSFGQKTFHRLLECSHWRDRGTALREQSGDISE